MQVREEKTNEGIKKSKPLKRRKKTPNMNIGPIMMS